MKPETKFRVQKINPFLKTLKNTYVMSIQQKAKSGDPDYVLCVRSLFCGLEIKAEDGVVSAIQSYVHEKIYNAYGRIFIVYPSGFKEFKKYLTQLDKGEIK